MQGYALLLLLLPAHALDAKKMAARKVAAVIGYGPGIGHSCAALWSSKGYSVALVSRTASKLEAAATQIPNSAAFPCDITDNAALTTTMKSIAEKTHIHFNLIREGGGGFISPSIFTQEIVREFHRRWNLFPNDPDSPIPPCMGYKLRADENPFERKAVTTL